MKQKKNCTKYQAKYENHCAGVREKKIVKYGRLIKRC